MNTQWKNSSFRICQQLCLCCLICRTPKFLTDRQKEFHARDLMVYAWDPIEHYCHMETIRKQHQWWWQSISQWPFSGYSGIKHIRCLRRGGNLNTFLKECQCMKCFYQRRRNIKHLFSLQHCSLCLWWPQLWLHSHKNVGNLLHSHTCFYS